MQTEGLYLYCFREKTKDAPAIATKGIDGKGEVFALPYRELEAIVSKVSLEEFGSSEIQKRAQEDLIWIKEKALIHEKVIEEAMRNKDNSLSIIPMRFGTIFKEKTGLEETLNKDYAKIKEVLDKIRGKQEWSVKIYLKDKQRFEQTVKEKNEVIKGKEKEIASLPEGIAFFIEEELKEAISKESDKALNNIVEILFERLGKSAVASVKNKILGKELTGRHEPMVLNTAYLISEDKIEDFKRELDDLNQQIQTKGFYLEYSGPWPVYNFTSY
ncbi:MAG: GvpL/GvpF family gas vesicle protein [Candidatus Omnitrophota bacterium]|nr:GvpL/GvpF family gas vesicle protein [Candidatus Omnitrophota bacterium]